MFNQTNSQENTLVRDGATIAYRRTEGSTPGVIFMGGFKSDMTGTKAVALECAELGYNIRCNSIHPGVIENLFASDLALDQLDADRRIELPGTVARLIGPSMGGWMMLLTALARPDRVAGLVGIAAAPDFT